MGTVPRRALLWKILAAGGLIRSPIMSTVVPADPQSLEAYLQHVLHGHVLAQAWSAPSPAQQFLGLGHGRRGVRGLTVGSDDVGVLLVTGAPPTMTNDLVAQAWPSASR